MTLDRVYTVTDFYDGPRGGVASFRGAPHCYTWQGEVNGNNWPAIFLLWPIDAATFELAREDWVIWLRWEAAFKSGVTTLETHPALPDDRPRMEQLQALLERQFKLNSEAGFAATGVFQQDADGTLWVHWTPL